MTVSLLYKVARRVAVRPVDAARRDTAKDVELLAPRRENAVLRRQIAGPVRSGPVRSEPATGSGAPLCPC
ncbi:integrase [Streptomyces cathayae]|uniref:Integrase n=1 Tax=Streptomyces cathayae TaxID=3031124 RepID=A0ABY8JSW9_9ACTN|nr:integrase [Streptomyces sp. HUAS 5]WGD39079.1 integrase [Streptomyces sp. HUAS 5]